MGIKYSVLMISYNGGDRVPYALEAIRKNTNVPKEDYEIILLDDGSFPEQREIIKKACETHQVKFLTHAENKNLGIVKSWNRVIEEASTNNIALLNDDIIVMPNWLKSGMYFIENNDDIGTVGFPTLYMFTGDMRKYSQKGHITPIDPNTKQRETIARLEAQKAKENDPPGICSISVGCAFCFKKSVWAEIGKFDENITSLYEEYDFGTRLWKAGLHNFQLRTPLIYHVLSGTFMANPQLRADKLLRDSTAYYQKKHGGLIHEVVDKIRDEKTVHKKVKFLDKDLNNRHENFEM